MVVAVVLVLIVLKPKVALDAESSQLTDAGAVAATAFVA